MPLLGAHMSIEGGLHRAFERISLVKGESLQIFSKNQRQWSAPALSASEIKQFSEAWKQWGKGPVAVHDSYLINLANPDTIKANRAVAAFADEISRAGHLGIPYLIMHPGSHVGSGLEKGLQQLTANLDRAFEKQAAATSVMVLLRRRQARAPALVQALRNCPCHKQSGVTVNGLVSVLIPAMPLQPDMISAQRRDTQ